MNHPPAEFEHRITFRVPKALADAITRECDKQQTNPSVLIRQSLVESLSLSPKEPRR